MGENSKERVVKYLNFKGIKNADFYRSTGLSNGFLDKTNNIGADKLEIIISKYPDLNIKWLVSGIGPMILDDTHTVSEPMSVYGYKERTIESQQIPLYDIDAIAGLVPLFYNGKQIPLDFIKIPHLPRCDGAVYVTGDSMYPLLKSGDIVLYKAIKDFGNDIFWGEMYLVAIDVDGEEYISVKYVQKGPDIEHIKLVSYNQHHAEKDVHIKKIRAMALVKASIRINSMR